MKSFGMILETSSPSNGLLAEVHIQRGSSKDNAVEDVVLQRRVELRW